MLPLYRRLLEVGAFAWAVVFKIYRILFVYKVHRVRSHCSEFPARGGGFLQRAPLGACAFTVASCIHAKGTFIANKEWGSFGISNIIDWNTDSIIRDYVQEFIRMWVFCCSRHPL